MTQHEQLGAPGPGYNEAAAPLVRTHDTWARASAESCERLTTVHTKSKHTHSMTHSVFKSWKEELGRWPWGKLPLWKCGDHSVGPQHPAEAGSAPKVREGT